MKTAVLLTGHLRSFSQAFPNIRENLLNNFGTWDVYTCIADVDTSPLLEYFTPKMQVPHFKQVPEFFDISFEPPKELIPGLLNQWKNVYLAKELLIESNIRYDYVIRLRPDISIQKPITPSDILPEGITISMYGNHSGEGRIGINDKLAIGPYNQMVCYCNFYISPSFRYYYGNSEQKLYNHLTDNNIPIKTLDNQVTKVSTSGDHRIDDCRWPPHV